MGSFLLVIWWLSRRQPCGSSLISAGTVHYKLHLRAHCSITKRCIHARGLWIIIACGGKNYGTLVTGLIEQPYALLCVGSIPTLQCVNGLNWLRWQDAMTICPWCFCFTIQCFRARALLCGTWKTGDAFWARFSFTMCEQLLPVMRELVIP